MTTKEKKEDEILGGNYDGIQEFDNDLPRWWVGLFYLTILCGTAYTLYVHVVGAPSDLEVLQAEMQELKQKQVQVAPADSEQKLLAALQDPESIARGQGVFTARCVACHGPQGEGLVGPNLTDEFWIHGGTPKQIQQVVQKGVLEKGMLAWKGVIPDEEISSVISFVWSIRNTNKPGKAPEGTKAENSR